MSVHQEAEAERQVEDKKEAMPKWWEALNIVIAHCSSALLMLDFEGQSAQFSLIVDSIDMAMGLCSIIAAVMRVFL